MSDGADWHDPFAEDPDAVERERRRAEREARRRGSLAEKVRGAEAPAESPPVSADAAAAAPIAADPAAPAQTDHEPAAPQTDEHAAAPAGVQTDEHAAAPPRERTPRRPPRGPRDSAAALRNRRIVGAIVFAAVVVLLIFGVVKVIGSLGGDDPPPAKAPPPKLGSLTIPEGFDRNQIAQVAKKAGLKGNYERASKSFKGFDLATYGAADAPSLEGFLFPATYELPKKATVKDLVSRQLEQGFVPNVDGVDLSYAKSKNLTVYDVLKIASMIEREVQVDKERKLVAEVIYNRLKAGMNLGIDATIRYEDQNYDEQLLESRLNEDTPYNTRTHPGLPPTPIGNPGLKSIEAAANPATGKLRFFVVKPGTCGEHVFVETEEEFAQAEAEYQAALQEQGGSPTSC